MIIFGTHCKNVFFLLILFFPLTSFSLTDFALCNSISKSKLRYIEKVNKPFLRDFYYDNLILGLPSLNDYCRFAIIVSNLDKQEK